MNSPICWIGGKKLLRKQIISMFPEKIDRYIEVFGGAGWVLFGRDKHAPLEVYNDAESNLVNLFRCIKYHCGELQKELEWRLNSREDFYSYKAQLSSPGLTDIQRAALFYMLIRISFGGDRRTFGCNTKNLGNAMEQLPAVSKRLNGVVIEHKDFENLINVYDRPGALFYCDPPYHMTEDMYDVPFNEEDHRRLRDALSRIKGRFLLSYNDDEFVRKLYSGFEIVPVERANNLASGSYKEIIVKNY